MADEIISILDDDFTYLFNTGKNYHAYRAMGAHLENGGVRFTVWAPGVKSIHVIGDFNSWIGPYLAAGPAEESAGDEAVSEGESADAGARAKSSAEVADATAENAVVPNDDPYKMHEIGTTGIWTCFVPNAGAWQLYKLDVENNKGKHVLKADPFAFTSESRPGTASRIADMTYNWQDSGWMSDRAGRNTFTSPMNTYEMHIGSWRRHEDGTFLTYVELADILPAYLKDMGYTHVEFMPLMEHPFDSSWGYQVTGYYAPTSRYGSPGDLRYLVDRCHQAGIGVILDWVPGHFCMDEHGLGKFNGSMLYESGQHPEWGTYKFDFSRPQVRSFLLSNAMYWIEEYHADGLRVDSVTSMLYLNYGIKDPRQHKFNAFGGDGDLEAVNFLRELNYMIGERCPGVFTVAEESTTWPKVTAPTDTGGLGFHYKWNMGWMNDTLEYMKTDFPDRAKLHDKMILPAADAYRENYVLAISHDEVVHGKQSLIGRMPGDIWQKFAGIRLLAMYQMTHPGKKLSFMGHELAEFIEWRDNEGLEWFMLDHENHRKYHEFIQDLNHFYIQHPALWDNDTDPAGFSWIDAGNKGQQIFTYVRRSIAAGELLIVALNAGVHAYDEFVIGVPEPGEYKEAFNSDALFYAGSGVINYSAVNAGDMPAHGMPYSITIKIPPLGGCILKRV